MYYEAIIMYQPVIATVSNRTCADKEWSSGADPSGGGGPVCFVTNVFHKWVVRTSLEKQLDPRSPIAS